VAAQLPVRKNVPVTPLAASADRIFGRPAELAPASNVSATTSLPPGMTVRSWPRSEGGNGAGGGGAVVSGYSGPVMGGTITGGWTGVCPASGVSVPVVRGEDDGVGDGAVEVVAGPGGVVDGGAEGGGAEDGGLPGWAAIITASAMARASRASATTTATTRRRPIPEGAAVTVRRPEPSHRCSPGTVR
jgi:hypothetical protein